MQSHILSIILFTPLVGTLLILVIPGEKKNAIRWVANIFALGGFLISLPLVPWFWAQRMEPGFKFMEGTANNWIPSIGAGYNLGIDGISFLLIMLTTLLGWSEEGRGPYGGLTLLPDGSLFGTTTSGNGARGGVVFQARP